MTRTKPSSFPFAHAARVADEQLSRAAAALHDACTLGCGMLPEARSQIRKVKVLMRLVDPFLEDHPGAEAEARLRALNRRLAPLAHNAAAVRTLSHLSARYRTGAAGPAIVAICEALVQRAERHDGAACVNRLLQRCQMDLAVERARIGTWRFTPHAAVTPAIEFERGIRQAAKDMTIAMARPATRDHDWRRCSTRLSVQLRLMEGGWHRLRSMVEAMDASLEEVRTVTVLGKSLRAEGLGSRAETATVLRLLRRYQRELRGRAVDRARAVLAGIAMHIFHAQGGIHGHPANVSRRRRDRRGSHRVRARANAAA